MLLTKKKINAELTINKVKNIIKIKLNYQIIFADFFNIKSFYKNVTVRKIQMKMNVYKIIVVPNSKWIHSDIQSFKRKLIQTK